jgi:hypothetical protein
MDISSPIFSLAKEKKISLMLNVLKKDRSKNKTVL